MINNPRVSLVNLWDQVITLRGQTLVSRTGDDTLRVLCWVLACVLVCVLVLVCHADPLTPSPPLLSPCVRSKRPPCVHSKHLRVYPHFTRKCHHMRAWWRYKWGCFECTHGGFQRATPHRTHTPRPQRRTREAQTTTTTHGDRDRQGLRETERETMKEDRSRRQIKKTEKEDKDKTRQDKTRDKTRQDKTGEHETD